MGTTLAASAPPFASSLKAFRKALFSLAENSSKVTTKLLVVTEAWSQVGGEGLSGLAMPGRLQKVEDSKIAKVLQRMLRLSVVLMPATPTSM